MCPHPLASLDCALVAALMAVPGTLAALVFALSALLGRPRGADGVRWGLALAGAVPSAFAAAALVAWGFGRLGLFRSGHDQQLVMGALVAASVGLESVYVLACRRALRPASGR